MGDEVLTSVMGLLSGEKMLLSVEGENMLLLSEETLLPKLFSEKMLGRSMGGLLQDPVREDVEVEQASIDFQGMRLKPTTVKNLAIGQVGDSVSWRKMYIFQKLKYIKKYIYFRNRK